MSTNIFWNKKSSNVHGVKLIDVHQGELKVSPEGGKLLTDLDASKNCNLCFVFGNARSGKSFMMNCLSGIRGLFQVINDSQPCTKGVDMSNQFIPHIDLADHVQTYGELDFDRAEDILCGFVDVEGQGAEGSQHDTMLALPLLLTGKVVLFNHKGAPTVSHMLSQMGVLARAAEYIEFTDGTDSEDTKRFGHLHVLFRDFSFEGDEKTIYDQLFKQEKVPKKQQGKSTSGLDPVKAAKERNSVRKLLLENFESVNVWLFRQPANADILMEVNELTADKVDSQFLDTVNSLMRVISKQLSTPTKFNGTNLTGSKLNELLCQVCSTINEGDSINVPSVFRAMEKNTLDRVHRECIELFNQKSKAIVDSFPIGEEQLAKNIKELEDIVFKKLSTELAECTLHEEKKAAHKDIAAHIKKTKENFESDNRTKTLDLVTQAYNAESANLKAEFNKFFDDGKPFENKQDLDSKFSSLQAKMKENMEKKLENFPGLLAKPKVQLININTTESLKSYFTLLSIRNSNLIKEKEISKLQQEQVEHKKMAATKLQQLKKHADDAKVRREEREDEVKKLQEKKKKTQEQLHETEEKIRQQKQQLEELKQKNGCIMS